MLKYLVLLFLILPFAAQSQAHLGKHKKEILKLCRIDFNDQWAYKKIDESSSFIKVLNEYETLYYFLQHDVCVKFMVAKPYSCNCLEQDIEAYNAACIPRGEGEWISKDQSKLYQMSLNQNNYTVSIVLLDERPANRAYDVALANFKR